MNYPDGLLASRGKSIYVNEIRIRDVQSLSLSKQGESASIKLKLCMAISRYMRVGSE